jgi:formylmethanofuran dehydrogenase subunit E
MTEHEGPYSVSLDTKMKAAGVNSRMQNYITQCVEFHTFPAPGVLIAAFMVDYALELLGAVAGQRLYAICETPKCAPDALQVIAHCTTGNKRLNVLSIGKFAMTVNFSSREPQTEGIRVYIDPAKLRRYPLIDSWYANSPAYNKRSMEVTLQDEIFRAGRDILSYERVMVKTSPKPIWRSVTCPLCGEQVPNYLLEDGVCAACGSQGYYEKIS